MQLILVRHGQAQVPEQASSDSGRQLTEFGERQAKLTADYICTHYQPDLLIVSPYLRAKQTLAALRQRLPQVPVSEHDNLTPNDDPHTAMTGLADVTGECVVVVCHMPIVAKLWAMMTDESMIPYQLAEARVLQMSFVAAGMGKQIDTYVPDQP